MRSLPGWTLTTNEVSNNVFQVTLCDSFGRKVEITDTELDQTINRAFSDAFEIEKQVSKNWSRFLFDVCVLQLGDVITKQDYNYKVFGSWFVEAGHNRLVYMGKDFWLVPQHKKDNEWFDTTILQKEQLTFSIFLTAINLTRSA